MSLGERSDGGMHTGERSDGGSHMAMLLSLADSRLPTGGHVHSGGVEEAISSGRVYSQDTLLDFLARRIRSSGLVSGSIAAAVCAGTLSTAEADAQTDARTPSPAAREASRIQGRGLLRLARRSWPTENWDALGARPHLPVVSGAVGRVTELTPRQAAMILVYTSMTSAAIAAQRLLALDPADVASCTFRLTALCDETADLASRGLASISDPLLDVLAQRHIQRERPLFVS